MTHRLLAASALAACAWLVACTSDDGGGDDCAANPFCEPDATDGGGDDAAAPVCTGGTAWAPGTTVFVDSTEAFGLGPLEVLGNRLSVVDVTNDGRPDIIARRAGVRWSLLRGDEAVRHHWLLENTGDGFTDITEASGLWYPRSGEADELRAGDVVVFGDVDNDGDLDAFVGVDATSPDARGARSELMRNDGSGAFEFGSSRSALRRVGQSDAPGGAAFVDVDRDGWLDLWVARNNPATGAATFLGDSLFRNGPDGFEDITADLGLSTTDWNDLADINEARAHSRAWSAAACDLNDDGSPELLAASYGRAPNHLWRATDDGYVNASVASGYAYDEDQTWTDNQFAACFCQENPDEPGCDGAIAPSIQCNTPNWNHAQDREPFRLGGNSGTTVCADLDNDGHLDLVTTEIKHWWAGSGSDGSDVLRNTGDGDVVFERMAREAIGLEVPHVTTNGWDEGHITAAVFDADNDGWKDIYIGGSEYAGNRGLLYLQTAPMQFELVDDAAPEHNRAQGVIPADLDGDGDLDLVLGHSRNRCDANAPHDCYDRPLLRIFENTLGDAGNWLQLDLLGADGSTNRRAVGARVEVRAGDLLQVQEVGGGYGHYGMQTPHTLHFGLGAACEAEVTIRWPDATLTEQTVTLGAGARYLIEQGAEPEVVTLPQR